MLLAIHGLGHMKHEQKMINHSPLASLVLSVCYHGNSDNDPVLSVPTAANGDEACALTGS